MKKEMFNLIVERILAQPELFSTHKVTKKDGLEVHTFGNLRNTDLAEAKALFKEKGYKMSDADPQAEHLNTRGKLTNTYLSILYGAEKDKISISLFDTGFAGSYRKGRYYPLSRNTPILAYTQKMYGFKGFKKQKVQPRIQLGNIYVPNFDIKISNIITKTMLGVDYIPKAKISYRHFTNTKNDLEAIGKMFEVKVPKALELFEVNEVLKLYKTIKDFNQINKLCQFIAKEDGDVGDLSETIAWMLFGDNHDGTYLVRDSIADNLVLKTRGISLAVTSKKRWEDEHQKMAKIRMLKGTPDIKTEEIFEKALIGLEYPFELIKTKERLIAESVDLHHCVATYTSQINSGRYAIFSVGYEGEQYTLQVGVNAIGEDVVFNPVQFRGSCNKSAPDTLGKRVAEVLALNKCKNPNVGKKIEVLEEIF
jgi:hypothetical protein